MTRGPWVLDGRRTVSPQAPLAREVPRARIVDALTGRFRCSVTAVVAGAGSGKTTALAQAVRSNLVSPMGIDCWVSCEPADEDDLRLAAAMVAALGSEVPIVGSPVEAVVSAMARHAPLDVCLVIDDVHRLPPGSDGERLLGRLLELLPRNGHIVVSSRRRPPVPLARRRAADDVLELGPDELAFGAEELASMAALYESGPGDLADLGGWPALVALSLSSGGGSATDFLWEEIVDGLCDESRRALLAMATLGAGSYEDAVAVTDGDGTAVGRIGRIVETIPLISGDPVERTFEVHDLWSERVGDLFPDDEVATTRAKARAVMIDQGQALRLGSLALLWRDDEALRSAAMALVETRLVQLPVVTAKRWLAATPPHLAGEPELRLLALAVDVATRPAEPALDQVADEVIESLQAGGDPDGSVVAGTLAVTAAYRRGDLGRVVAVAERLRRLPGGEEIPIVQAALRGVESALSFLEGDLDSALGAIEAIPLGDLPSTFADFIRLAKVNFLLEVGEANEAVRVAATVVDVDPALAVLLAVVRWSAGEPGVAASEPIDLGNLDALDDRSRFIHSSAAADIGASLGLAELALAARVELARSLGPADGARHSGVAAGAIAKTLVLDHDEPAARAVIEDHLSCYTMDDEIGERQLRRQLATVYLLHDGLAKRWDSVDLGDVHRRGRDIARLVREARQGRLAPGRVIDDPDLVISCLPLPWTVELAIAARQGRVTGASALIDRLIRHALGPARAELRRLISQGDDAAPAEELLAELPEEGGPPLQVDVLGPMSVSLAGEDLGPTELRRGRVRTLLSILIVRGPTRRDELIEFLWPDQDIERGRQNLRATLSRLRRLLHAGGGAGGSTRLRTEGDLVSLVGAPGLEVDLWELRRLVTAADEGATGADGDGPIELLRTAVALWRGSPVPDLEPVVGMEAEIEHIRAEVVEACHRLGELCLTVGQFDEALRCADRVLLDAPYSERAHRLAVSALLHLGDRSRLERRMATLREMLDDLGMDPEPSTSTLLTRATT